MSQSLRTWRGVGAVALDEIEAAHAAVGGQGRGRRYATQQINQAYAVLLSSRFQRFCRDLHSECVDFLTGQPAFSPIREILRGRLTENRKLDTGNPNPGNIGSDFGRLGIVFWDEIRRHDQRNNARKTRLEQMNRWRNAIGHQDFTDPALGGRVEIRLLEVQQWRQACDMLAGDFDAVLRAHLTSMLGQAPW